MTDLQTTKAILATLEAVQAIAKDLNRVCAGLSEPTMDKLEAATETASKLVEATTGTVPVENEEPNGEQKWDIRLIFQGLLS